jgi:hypothetical protein
MSDCTTSDCTISNARLPVFERFIVLERYDRIDDGSRPGYAGVRLASVTGAAQGKVDLVPPHAIHAARRTGPLGRHHPAQPAARRREGIAAHV